MDAGNKLHTTPAAQPQKWLENRLQSRISLIWTDNRISMISFTKRSAAGYHLRLHHMFQVAPEPVWQALAEYMQRKNKAAKHILQTYISQQQSLIRQSQPISQRTVLTPRLQGRHVDLGLMYQNLNRQYFNNRIEADIMWMRMAPHRQRASIRFGVYDRQYKIIRIHRLLDQPFVPHYFVESIIFHEMLHQLIPAIRIRGQWRNHPPAFQQAERAYPNYEKARQWERENLHRLLCKIS